MKQFIIALDKEGKRFEYLYNTFPSISIKNMRICDGIDIRKLVKDPHFIELMNGC